MAFSKYANAQLITSEVTFKGWDDICNKTAKSQVSFANREARVIIQSYNPKDYMLTHCTIMASVDTENGPGQLGSHLENGFEVHRTYPNYYVTLPTQKFINNNNDGWDRNVLLQTYRSFVGAYNYLEHIQQPELSKGRIIDAAARDIGESVYIDILVATERKHRPLIAAITSGSLSTLSMGCTVEATQCTQCGNVAADETQLCFTPGTRVLLANGDYCLIEEVVKGDQVITHTGASKNVLRTMSKPYSGEMKVLNVDGVPSEIRATPEHPFWALRAATECACGCGSKLNRTVEHERGAAKAFQRRFRVGHATRLKNPHAPSNVVDLSELFDVDFEFVEAKNLHKGDYLAFPIPKETIVTEDATVRKARLIGYFAAEGSFAKVNGERTEVEFSLGYHEYDTLAEEICQLLDAEFGGVPTHPNNWQELVASRGIKPARRRCNSRHVPENVSCPHCGAPSQYAYKASFNPKRDDSYKCKACSRCWNQDADRGIWARKYACPVDGPNSGSTQVRFTGKKVADFFFKYCGEYASSKKLHPDVLKWPSDIQGHVLRTWLGGDGSQNLEGVRGNSASFHLLSQMHILAARSGLYARKSVVFGNKATTVEQVVNGDGSVTKRDHRGWLPSFKLTLSEPHGFSSEPRFYDAEKARVTMSAFTDSFKRVGDWFVYRIRDIGSEFYEGPVHNLEVEDDNSYVVEGLAVHNCNHIKYAKGNDFIDDLGRKRKIAELCGHTALVEGGVKFIEASWVGNPAFKGAVLRNILSEEEIKSIGGATKLTVAFSQPVRTADPTKMQRAAKTAQFGMDDQAPKKEAPKEADPMNKAVDDLVNSIRDKATRKIREDLDQDNLNQVKNIDENRNETLIKSAIVHPEWKTIARKVMASTKSQPLAKKVLAGLILHKNGGWSEVLKVGSFSGRELLGISRLLDTLSAKTLIAGENRVYRTVIAVGGMGHYPDIKSYLTACRHVVGRDLSSDEQSLLIDKGRLFALGKS